MFIAYSIIASIDLGKEIFEHIETIFFTFYFTFFLILGQILTSGMYTTIPMAEKKGGLRQMMFMNGLKSHEYFLGLFLGDMLLFTLPAIVISLALIPVGQIMISSQIPTFFLSFMLFGACQINLSYLISHLFDNPDTATVYIQLIFSLGLFVGPITIASICTPIFGFSKSVTPWYLIDPVIPFIV